MTAHPRAGGSSYIICECGESKGNHKTPWTLYGREGDFGCAKTHCPVFSAARGRHNEQAYRGSNAKP